MNQILLMLGLNVSGFKAGIKQAADQTKGFEQDWKNLKKIFTVGGIGTLAIGVLRSMASEAAQARDELEKMGEPIPQHIRALSAVDEAFKMVGKGAMIVVGSIISGWMQIGDVIGSTINNLRGISDATQTQYANIAKDAEDTAKRIAKAREDHSPEKIAKAEAELAQVRKDRAFAEADGNTKLNMLLAEQVKLLALVESTGEHSINGATARLALEKNEIEYSKQLAVVKKAEAEAREKGFAEDLEWVKKTDAERSAAEKNRQAALEAENKRQQELYNLQSGKTVLVKDQFETEVAISAQKKDQLALLQAQNEAAGLQNLLLTDQLIIAGKIYGASRDPNDITRSSDAELKELVRRQKEEIARVKGQEGRGPSALADAASGYLIHGAVIARLQTDINRAQFELEQRAQLRGNLNYGGEDFARKKFAGDPLRFDDYVARVTQLQDKTDKTNDLLQDLLNAQRAGGGIPATIESLADRLDRGLANVATTNTAIATRLNR